jgi:aminomethyltransferase
MLRTTPFHQRTSELVRARTWRRWAGHEVASAYDPHPDREYAAIRNAAALIDVSPLHKYMLRGPDAVRLLDRMVTRDVTRCRVGQVLYTPWCDNAGKVLDDGTISRLDEDVFRLTSAEPNSRWLSMNAVGLDVSIEDVSHAMGALALQGPLSRTILEQVSPADFGALKFFKLVETTIAGAPVTISRTGYTGDLGYEIWIDAGDALAVWDALMAVGSGYGITPAGIWALDIARIEAGLVMLDVDYHSAQHALIEDQKSSPFELGLAWTVSKGKGPFNGRRALEAERDAEPQWRFVGIAVDWESLERLYAEHGLPPNMSTIAWRASTPVYRDGRQIGYATSGCWSPLLKRYLALAHLQSPHFVDGGRVQLEVTVEHRRQRADAIVRTLPVLEVERKRA